MHNTCLHVFGILLIFPKAVHFTPVEAFKQNSKTHRSTVIRLLETSICKAIQMKHKNKKERNKLNI